MFYVLRVSVSRVVHTKNSGIICSVINIINDVIRDKLVPTIGDRVALKKDAVAVPRRVLMWMNGAQASKQYCNQLAKEFEALCKKHFGGIPGEMAKFIEQAHDIQLSANAVGDLLQGWIRHVARIVTRRMVEAGMVQSGFEQLSYVLTQEMLLHYEINDAWVRSAIVTWDMILARFQQALNAANFDDLIVEIVSHERGLTKQLEDSIMRKQFDLCGGLQIDKDVRAVKQYFSVKTERPVREKFTRLSHITSLLILDKVHEVEELWAGAGGGGGSLMWRLSPQEAQRVLGLRRDFAKEDIKRLRLGRL